MTVEKLASILTPLVETNPKMRVVLSPCSPGEDFVDVEKAEKAIAGEGGVPNEPEPVLVIS